MTQRLGHIQAKSLCSSRLAGGHATGACKSCYRCRECGQAHHTTIHQQPAAATPSINSTSVQSHQVPDALMTTAQVILVGPLGKELKARALIDSGAGLSLISNRVTQLLNLPLEPSKIQFAAVQGAPCKPANYVTSLLISPLLEREKQILCKPVVVQMVTCDLPPEPVQPVTDLTHLMGLQLADTTYHLPGRIDILLGADLASQIMLKQLLRSGADSEPITQATLFGWTISGPVRRRNSSAPSISTHHHLVQTSHHNQIPLPDHRRDQAYLSSLIWTREQPVEEEASSSLVEEQVRPHSVNVTCSSSDSTDQVTFLRKPETQPVGDSQTQSLSRHIQSKKTILSNKICDSIQEEAQSHSLNPAEPEPASEPSSSHQPSSDSSSAILPADFHQISFKQPPKVESILQSTPQDILYLSVKTTQQTAEDSEAKDFFNNPREVILKGSFNIHNWRMTFSEVIQAIQSKLQKKCSFNDFIILQASDYSRLGWTSTTQSL